MKKMFVVLLFVVCVVGFNKEVLSCGNPEKVAGKNEKIVSTLTKLGWQVIASFESCEDPALSFYKMEIEKKGSAVVWPMISMLGEPQIVAFIQNAKGTLERHPYVFSRVTIREGKIDDFNLIFLPNKNLLSEPSFGIAYSHQLLFLKGNTDGGIKVEQSVSWGNSVFYNVRFPGTNHYLLLMPNDNGFEMNPKEKQLLKAFKIENCKYRG